MVGDVVVSNLHPGTFQHMPFCFVSTTQTHVVEEEPADPAECRAVDGGGCAAEK